MIANSESMSKGLSEKFSFMSMNTENAERKERE